MILFPIIENEPLVQENDKTRLDAKKSFGSGTGSIAKIEIQPARTEAFYDVSTDLFLDWAYPFEIEVDAANDKVSFSDGGGAVTATLTHGTYSLVNLAAEIESQMQGIGTLTYIARVSATNVLTISAEGAFNLDPTQAKSILPELGFSVPGVGLLAYSGAKIETIGKTITVRLTDDANATKTTVTTMDVISALADGLYSNDQDLRTHENDILKYVSDGRASYKDLHRRAQTLILDWINKNGWTDIYNNKIDKSHILDFSEVKEWSTFMVLKMIFRGNINSVDDVFTEKAKEYEEFEQSSRSRLVLRLDLNKSGEIDHREQITPFQSAFVVRR